MKRPPRLALGLLALATWSALAACGGDGAAARAGRTTVLDSAGVTMVDSAGVTLVSAAAEALEALPASRYDTVVTVDGHAADAALVQVLGLHWFADGRLAVLDAANHHVHFVGPDGSVIRTVGGEGDGPGEFRTPGRMFALPGDSLLIVDRGTARATVLGPDGAFVRVAPLRGPLTGLPVGVLADGTLAHESPQGDAAEFADSPQPTLRYAFIRLYAADGTLADSIGPFPDRITHGTDRGYSSPLFSPVADFAAWAEGVWVAPGLAPELLKVRRDGTVERVVRWAAPPRPVTQEDRDALLEATLEGAPRGTDPAEIRRYHERALFASRVPPYRRIAADREAGAVWVEGYDLSYGRDPTPWLVFAADGRPLARVILPAGFRVWEVRDGVVSGTVHDDLDVPMVLVLRVHGLGSGDGPTR